MKEVPTTHSVALRSPDRVMRLVRLGQSMPTRLSFLRILMRHLNQAGAVPHRRLWDMDCDGFGHAVYTISLGSRSVSLVAFSQYLDPNMRSDRVIATAWDAAFVLYDGVPDEAEIARLAEMAPKQEAGRFTERDLVLSRANKSVRLWAHVVQALRAGSQPDKALLNEVGYLMRTTAVYGNGKFGIADRHIVQEIEHLSGPFAAEMLTIWLIREFTLDLVEHVGGATLEKRRRRSLGIGNATGLGMAPFLVTHPVLLNNWMVARETALARIRAESPVSNDRRSRLIELAQRAERHLLSWRVPDEFASRDLDRLRDTWAMFGTLLPRLATPGAIYDAATDDVALEELVVALLLEAYPEHANTMSDAMSDPFGALIAPFKDTDSLKSTIEKQWAWALKPYDKRQTAQFWYVSAAKLEPRIGRRYQEAGSDLETPLDIAKRVADLYHDLPAICTPVCELLTNCPDHTYAVQRVAILARYPYAEIRDNLISRDCRPIDMLRGKLAFFGATRFDPKSDLWTRVTLAQGAPMGDEIATCDPDDWWLPEPLT